MSILLYLADSPILNTALVLLAFMFLIVVDSSTANRKSLLCIKASKYLITFAVAKASTFTNRILSLSLVFTPSSKTTFSVLLALAFQTYTFFSTLSGK